MSWPACIVALLGALSIAAAGALIGTSPLSARIDLDPSTGPLLPIDDPGAEGYRQAVLDFGDDEVYVIAMETPEVFTAPSLKLLRELGREISQLDAVRTTESVSHVTVIRNDAEQDAIHVGPLIRDIPDSPDALLELREQALADPLLVKGLISRDGRTAALNVRLRDLSDLALIRDGVDRQIQSMIAERASGEYRFHLAGRPHMKAVAHRTMMSDLQRLIPLSIGVMALVLWLLTGSLRGVVIPLGTALIATLWTFGLMAQHGVSLNLLTVVLGPVLIAVGSVYGVHILAHYESVVVDARSARDAAWRLSAATRTPVIMAGTTTAIGFATLLLTNVPAARELGAFAALGTLFVMLISLVGVPAFVALLPLREELGTRYARSLGAALDGGLARLSAGIARRPTWIILGWAVLCLAAGSVVARIEIDTDYLTFFPEHSPLRRDFDAVNVLLAGVVPIYVVLSGDASDTFSQPENLRVLERIQHRFDSLPGVSQTVSLVDQVQVVNRAVREGDPAEARIPDTEGELLELLHLIPKARKRPFANVDHSRANLIVRTGEQGSEAVRSLVDSLEVVLQEELSRPLRYEITGDTVLLNRSADTLAWQQLRTVGVTALAIFTIVVLVFRSVPLALVAMLPNIVPVLLFYGLLGAGVAPLSLPTSLIGAIVLGIAVDDTVHFLSRYRARRAAGLSPEEAVIDCGRRVGRPIVITSVMLFFGFLVVALSGFATLREFGLLVGLTIAICLVTDLILLPALLVWGRVR
jgi:hypothetical protein